MIGKISFFSKAANSLTDDDVRISKRLYVPYSKLRGFEKGKVGPKDSDSYIGGNYVSTLNLSTTLPQILPSFQNTDFFGWSEFFGGGVISVMIYEAVGGA